MPSEDVDVYGVVYAGDVDEAFLLGDAGGELVGGPGDVCGVDAEDFVQEVAAVLAYGDEVVSFALHMFGVVFDQKQGAGRVVAEGACGPQAFVDVFGKVLYVEDGLAPGQGGVDP